MKYTKICKHCGESFETNKPNQLYCSGPHFRPCPVCGEPVQMIDNDFSRPPKCCSTECSHKLRQTKFKQKKCIFCGEMFTPKSGVQIACDKIHYDKCEICDEEFIRTVANMNDGLTTCSDECTREKMRRNSLEKYSTEHPMQNKDVKKRFSISSRLNQPTPPIRAFDHPEIFSELLDKNNIHYQLNFQLDSESFDFYLPDNETVLSIDPTSTHSNIDRYYHRDKTQLALDSGYRCIHVFDWDKLDSIVDLVRPIEHRIFARKCTVFRLNKDVGDQFLNKYHIQGSCRGQLLYLGLVYDDELLMVMTFGKSRYDKNYYVELMRMCTKPGVIVVGGASRLFSYATSEYGLSNIISYCDRSKFTGHVYGQMGMKLKRTTPPQEVWSKSTQHITANLLRARGYDQLFNTDFGKGASNDGLMIKNGWLPIYDCGQAVYELV